MFSNTISFLFGFIIPTHMRKECRMLFVAVLFLLNISPAYAETAKESLDQGITAVKKNDFNLAFVNYNRAIELDNKYALAYLKRGYLYLYIGKNNEAISDFSKVIVLNPKEAIAYIARGCAFARKSDFDKAIVDSNKGIEIDPNLAFSYNSRGFVYYLKGDMDHAMNDYNKAIDIIPDFAVAYYNRGLAYYGLEQYDKALDDYKRTKSLKKKNKEAYEDFIKYVPEKKSSDTTNVREEILSLLIN